MNMTSLTCISQLIRFARVSSHVADFNARNKSLTAKLLQQGYRYSGGSRGGLGGSNEPPLEPKLFHFHGEFQKKMVKQHKSNPPQLIWTPDPKILDPPLRYHKLRKTFSKFYRRHYELVSKFNVGLNILLHQGLSEPEFHGDLIYKFKIIVGRADFFLIS